MFCLFFLEAFFSFIFHKIIQHILKDFKNECLIQCQFLPKDRIFQISVNEIDKSDQLACIWYKNKKVSAYGEVTSQKFKSNRKFKSHRVTWHHIMSDKRFCNQYFRFQQQKKSQIQIRHFKASNNAQIICVTSLLFYVNVGFWTRQLQ